MLLRFAFHFCGKRSVVFLMICGAASFRALFGVLIFFYFVITRTSSKTRKTVNPIYLASKLYHSVPVSTFHLH